MLLTVFRVGNESPVGEIGTPSADVQQGWSEAVAKLDRRIGGIEAACERLTERVAALENRLVRVEVDAGAPSTETGEAPIDGQAEWSNNSLQLEENGAVVKITIANRAELDPATKARVGRLARLYLE